MYRSRLIRLAVCLSIVLVCALVVGQSLGKSQGTQGSPDPAMVASAQITHHAAYDWGQLAVGGLLVAGAVLLAFRPRTRPAAARQTAEKTDEA